MKRLAFVLVYLVSGCGPGEVEDPDAGCAVGAENTAEACGDGCSNDGDPEVDCADPDCTGVGSCSDAGPPIDAGPNCLVEPDGTSCGSNNEFCLNESCVASMCGDGMVRDAAGEDCEDGNTTPGDGCEPDCRFTCSDNTACDDVNVCTGAEVCQADHTCSTPPDMDCDDDNPCTVDSCDPVIGCAHALIDADADGYASMLLGACTSVTTPGGDCNDVDPSVHPNAPDGCNNPPLDNDCDGTNDEDGAGAWYADCDGDGYAASGAVSQNVCVMPTMAPGTCGSGTWTELAPTGSALRDCNDGVASIHPGATEVVGNSRDDDCNGEERCYRDVDGDGYRTDEVITSTSNTNCTNSGEAEASDTLEWPVDAAGMPSPPAARHLCCDQHPLAHTGASYVAFNMAPGGNTACPAGRRWDFNCNGSEERQYTADVGRCYSETAFACNMSGDTSTTGWLETVPACGSGPLPSLWVQNGMCGRVDFDTCAWTGLEMRLQGCR